MIQNLSKNPNMIFVFGSNLSGIHGAGAAAHARLHWGAQWGVGEGLTGQAYALPTKEKDVATTRSLEAIQDSLRSFVAFAVTHPHLFFLVTPVGCGLAGLNENTVADLLKTAGGPTANMLFTASWLDPEVY